MDIEWIESAVCFADGKQWFADGEFLRCSPVINCTLGWALVRMDFQLNTIKQGDCVENSELDSGQKYNDVVEVFKLLGFKPVAAVLNFNSSNSKSLTCVGGEIWRGLVVGFEKRKLTYQQIMAIGELKRLIDRRKKRSEVDEFMAAAIKDAIDIESKGAVPIFNVSSSVSKVNRDIERNQPKNKSKQAYAILESLDYEYDLVKQKWFRKEWV